MQYLDSGVHRNDNSEAFPTFYEVVKGNGRIEQKVMALGPDNVSISFITVSELYYGVYKSQRVDQNLTTIRRLTGQLNVIESDEAIERISYENTNKTAIASGIDS